MNQEHNDDKKIKVIFADGCFDDFEGTQEELDELLAEINKVFGDKTVKEIQEMSKPVDIDSLDPKEYQALIKNLKGRNLRH